MKRNRRIAIVTTVWFHCICAKNICLWWNSKHNFYSW